MASLCNIFLQFKQLFKGLTVSKHKVRVSNYLVWASNSLLIIPKKFSAARGKVRVRGLAQLIKYAFAFFVCISCINIHHKTPWLNNTTGVNKTGEGNSKTRLKIHTLKLQCKLNFLQEISQVSSVQKCLCIPDFLMIIYEHCSNTGSFI